MHYTTLDGRPLAWPQSGATVVWLTPTIFSVVWYDCVFIPPPPSLPGDR